MMQLGAITRAEEKMTEDELKPPSMGIYSLKICFEH